MSTSPAPAPPRRTQAERSEATRAALLDACTASLIEHGWSGTSARGVAERAGVSQGAQQHHFPTKAALVAAALERIARGLIEASREEPDLTLPPRERAARLLDLLWGIHHAPAWPAVTEILALARFAPIGRQPTDMLLSATDLACAAAERAVPEYARGTGFRDAVLLSLATMRGTALAELQGAESALVPWPVLREQLLTAWEACGAPTR
ncbi:TetR/AcrR family transcriptional regulator [Actinomadura rupiterrae]|uniref:TetR/AcrR family transcriptional regulator n=1 Tax=Actinomadura rupiterrae TaxID=559627 RepID=UPI0020A39FA6|nr:TetR/AcrR family transcriptional regulator [Actinomadura rupiterrae]MCP2338933.1 AcrR family transcriptional regulator [Actinomadura rupiterrae]